ncbi:arginyl-tRNA synthetase [Nonlabens dokdonensis]|uniref:Arginine--tRNA ligase n=2 Tax=Nonlabens dokdonensis TaxID=328515 RepID=L7WEE2_NONDD|nr:arginine--tRNA ligase [Nonlabens dokdonensis]AGC77243.1 arginyl-tRNA synthetase [Nonlabens dokdonensis DSW-6]PZX40778.1 arginyl-tRNA synthetase [Nonlabens dokdonensis]
MTLFQQLEIATKNAVTSIFSVTLENVEITLTRKDQNGDFTIMVFPMLRHIKGNPAVIGEKIGTYLKENTDLITDIEVIKGFLNVKVSSKAFLADFNLMLSDENYGTKGQDSSQPGVMVEYSSPNTNKPLHLGHVRNNLLGYSVANIIEATGRKVYKTQIINDRGIHICKSMLAWERYGNGETPATTGLKGDKLVGNYYVKFDQEYKKEIAQLIAEGKTEDEAKKQAPSLIAAQQMLQKWEQGDEEVVALWKKMNGWVYDGFDITYKNLGVNFDSLYYESNTYLLGKDVVQQGLDKGVFEKDPDGSVWIDLTEDGLDRKIVLRSDGTAVYMTQDIGTAIQRVKDHHINSMVYTVGNEQDYHFKVLFLILKKLGFDWAENLYHLSYGMVELPSGKMKSREGTVVDADELMEEMTATAKEIAQEQGKLEGLSDSEKENLYKMIGLGALKYFMLKVDPKKSMMFDPEESVDFQGNTGPFIQYTHARIKSILKKSGFDTNALKSAVNLDLTDKDIAVIKSLQQFPDVIQTAADKYSPALVANYVYELVKEFNSFYQNVPKIVEEENADLKQFRLLLCYKTAAVVKSACSLMGIEVPEQM